MKNFKNLKLTTKIMGMLIVTLLIMSMSSVFGIFFLTKIGAEIEEIAELDIPLIEIVTKISTHQLEQAINFERILRYGLQALTDSGAKEELIKAERAFESFNKKVNEELKDAEALAEKAVLKATTAEAKAEFAQIDERLKKIEEEHATYYQHVSSIIKQVNKGDIAEALEAAKSVEIEEEKLDHEIAAFLTDVEKFTEKSALQAAEDEKTALMGMVVATGGGIILALLMGIFVSRSITKPISQTVGMLKALEQGDLTNRLHLNRGDEIGIMAAAMDNFAENLSGLVDNIRNCSGQVSDSSSNLTDIANVLASGSEENAVQANNVSSATEQLSTNVNTVATAVEEMSSTIKEITGTVVKSSATTEQAVQRSNKASEVIGAVNESSEAIGRITDLISSIAAQTNILALNATIEAARAGDAGKGFAVVANEVKELATETSKATDEIVSQISGMQTNAKEAVTAMDEIGSVLAEVNTYANTISAAIEEQSSTTAEIARSMNEAATGVKDIVSNVTGVAESAAENSKKSAETKSAADDLGKVSKELSRLVSTFKTNRNASKDWGHSGSNGGKSASFTQDAADSADPASKMHAGITGSESSEIGSARS